MHSKTGAVTKNTTFKLDIHLDKNGNMFVAHKNEASLIISLYILVHK